MSNVFLVGHGARRGWGGYKLQKTPLPPGITLIFYCVDGGKFDGHWEAAIRQKTAAGQIPKAADLGGPPEARKEYQREVWKEPMYDYYLGFPGNVTGALPKDQLRPLSLNGIPDQDKANEGYKDKTYRVSGKQSPVISLHQILASLPQAPPGGLTVHWLACREYFDSEAQFAQWQKDIVKGDYSIQPPEAVQRLGANQVGKLNIGDLNRRFVRR